MYGGHTMHLFYKSTTYPTGYSVPQELSTEGDTEDGVFMILQEQKIKETGGWGGRVNPKAYGW